MYSSVKKLPTSHHELQNLSVESKKHRSISKQPQYLSKSGSISSDNIDHRIRSLMTSNAYNSLFNRLVNLNNLKQFIHQSSQYVEFHQQQVMKYIPSGHNVKTRFSFSLKKSICSYLERDYRFLRHYYTLLVKEFPEKSDYFRQEIFSCYRDIVVDRKRFDQYFAPNNIPKSQRKYQHEKINFCSKSAKKTNNKSIKKTKCQASVPKQKSKKKNASKVTNQSQISNGVNQNYPKELVKKDDNIKYRLRSSKKLKNTMINFGQNDSKAINLTEVKGQRRTTMQNIKLIEQTLHEIESIFSKQQSGIIENKQDNCENKITGHKSIMKLAKNTNRTISKPLIEQETRTSIQQQNLKAQIGKNDKDEQQMKRERQTKRQQELFRQQEEYINRIDTMRSNNRSRKKRKNLQDLQGISNDQKKSTNNQTIAKDKRKSVPFSEFFDINDPQYKQVIQTMQKIKKQKELKEKEKQQKQRENIDVDKVIEELHKSITLSRKNRKLWRPFNEKEKQLLTPEEKQIVDLFAEINSVGDPQDFIIDRSCVHSHVLGEVNGYLVESIVVESLNERQCDRQIFKALHLTKLKQTDEQQKVDKHQKLSINQLKKKIPIISNAVNTLLLIEK